MTVCRDGHCYRYWLPFLGEVTDYTHTAINSSGSVMDLLAPEYTVTAIYSKSSATSHVSMKGYLKIISVKCVGVMWNHVNDTALS